ncbi:hypothetical protein CDIK_3170 [Cucumispora dikerogammari]|nr:hypothetical protein CDIK_3170 [Cucumispora dikerogammari]
MSNEEIKYFPVEFEEKKTIQDLLTLEDDKFPVFVSCYLERCPPCEGIKSALDESKFNKPLKLYRVNLRNDKLLRSLCGINSAPAFVVLNKKNNELVPIKHAVFSNISDFSDFFDVIIDDDF